MCFFENYKEWEKDEPPFKNFVDQAFVHLANENENT